MCIRQASLYAVGLRSDRCIFNYMYMATVPCNMVGLERMSDYRGFPHATKEVRKSQKITYVKDCKMVLHIHNVCVDNLNHSCKFIRGFCIKNELAFNYVCHENNPKWQSFRHILS